MGRCDVRSLSQSINESHMPYYVAPFRPPFLRGVAFDTVIGNWTEQLERIFLLEIYPFFIHV